MHKFLFFLGILSAFLLGVVAGPWLWPRDLMQSPPTEVAAVPPAPAPVSPPQAVITTPEPLVEPQSQQPEMQLKGVFVIGDGTRSVALIKIADAQPLPYRIEQKLPNGYTVKTISEKLVEVEKDGETISLPLVRAKASAAEPEAEEEPPVAEPTPAEAASATTPPPAALPSTVTDDQPPAQLEATPGSKEEPGI